jgi:hypothetical protein
LSVSSKDFPFCASIFNSGSKEVLIDRSRPSSPLKTESTMISAAVENATPTMDRMEMILMKFFFRFERKYREAIKSGKFKG